MAPAQIKPKRFRPLNQARDVGVAAQQIVDELPPRRLLLSNHLPPRCLMALDQYFHGVVDHPQHSFRSGPHLLAVPRPHDHRYLLPQPPSRREVQVDRLIGVDALHCCASTKSPNRCQLPLLRPSPRKGGVSKNVQILTQQLDRRVSISRRRTGHHCQPIIRFTNALCVALDPVLGKIPI